MLDFPLQHEVDDCITIGQAYMTILEMIDHAITYPITQMDLWRINKCVAAYEHFRKYVPSCAILERHLNKVNGIQGFSLNHVAAYMQRCTYTTTSDSRITSLNAEFHDLMERFVP